MHPTIVRLATRAEQEAEFMTGLNSLDRLFFFWTGLTVAAFGTMGWIAALGWGLGLAACLFAFLWGKRASELYFLLGGNHPPLTGWQRIKLVTPLTGLGF